MKNFSRHTRRLQWIDRRIGVVVCFFLTLVRRLTVLVRPDDPAAPCRSIVFVKLAEQGSTVLAAPTLREAVARVGREHVYLLVFEDNRFVVDLLGLIPADHVLTVDTRSAWSMAASCLRHLRALRRQRIDACVDLEFFTRFSAAISYLTGARRRSGFHTYFGEGPYRGDLLTHRVLYNPHLHTGAAFASLLAALDLAPALLPTFDRVIAVDPELPRFRAQPGETEAVESLLHRHGVTAASRLILLNANAGDLLPLRRWAARNYVELARRLLHEFDGVVVAFTGSPEEADDIAALVGDVASPRCICLAGQTTLRQLMVLYERAEVLVTNDSGPAHFAALTGIDVVALFGPETPALFAATGPRSHPLWAGLACSPCVNAYNNRQTACRDNVCMQRLSVDLVCATVCRIYRQRARVTA